MNHYSPHSEAALKSCGDQLQTLFRTVLEHFDHAVLEGHRDQDAQQDAYHSGRSKVPWPCSEHNEAPARAADVLPFPFNFEDLDVAFQIVSEYPILYHLLRAYRFAGFVQGVATQKGIDVVWGNDWNDDTFTNDTRFKDLPHWELADRTNGG